MNEKMHQFLSKVYALTGVGLLVSVVGGMLAHAAALTTMIGIAAMTAGIILIVAMSFFKGEKAAAIFLGFCFLEGIGLNPLLSICMAKSPDIVGLSAVMTAVLFVLLTGYVILSKKDFSFMRTGLFISLVILVVAGIVALFVPGMAILLSAASALIFSLYILYDTSKMINGDYADDEYAQAALNIYLDIVNLFIDILRICKWLAGQD